MGNTSHVGSPRIAEYIDSELVRACLEQFSKHCLMSVVADLARRMHGEEPDDYELLRYLRDDLLPPVLTARGERMQSRIRRAGDYAANRPS